MAASASIYRRSPRPRVAAHVLDSLVRASSVAVRERAIARGDSHGRVSTEAVKAVVADDDSTDGSCACLQAANECRSWSGEPAPGCAASTGGLIQRLISAIACETESRRRQRMSFEMSSKTETCLLLTLAPTLRLRISDFEFLRVSARMQR
jgi:hypothetical protein